MNKFSSCFLKLRSVIQKMAYLVLIMAVFPFNIQGQEKIDSLQNLLEHSEGRNKVDIFIQLSKTYRELNSESSYYYATLAEELAGEHNYARGRADASMLMGELFMNNGQFTEAIEACSRAIETYRTVNDSDALIHALYTRGKLYRISGDYDEALANFLESLSISEETGDKNGIAYAYLNIGIVYATRMGESSEKGLPFFLDALALGKEIKDSTCISYALNNIALVYLDLEEYDKALEYHFESLELKRSLGDKTAEGSSLGNIADIYYLKDDFDRSIEYNRQALAIYRELNEKQGIIYTLLELGHTYTELKNFARANEYLKEALVLVQEQESLQLKSGAYQYMFEYFEETGDFKNALAYHELYKLIEDSIYSVRSSSQIAEMRTLYETEKIQAENTRLLNEQTIRDLQIRKSENLKIFFIIALVLTAAIAGFAYYGFRQKQKANRFLEERNRFEIENKKKAINLFGQQVSKEVALELLSDSYKSGSKKLFACIMFLDIRDFTPFVADKEPDEIIQYQNDVFGFMIDLVSKHHGIINQFMGDGFMATFGAPASSGNDCQNAVDASIEIVRTLQKKSSQGSLPPTKIGVGLHAGHIVTGNVGTQERKQYSITGNTVILASRIEQLNKEYQSEILVSKEVFDRIDQQELNAIPLGSVILKGRQEPIEVIRIS